MTMWSRVRSWLRSMMHLSRMESEMDAAAHQILGILLNVETQLRVHLALPTREMHHAAQPRPNSAPHRHTSSRVICGMFATTLAITHISAPPWDQLSSPVAREHSTQPERRPSAARPRPRKWPDR